MNNCTFTRSAKRVRDAASVAPGGVNSNFRLGVAPTPLVFERGEGAYLVDIDGNRLIDYYLALGPMVLGHSPRDVIDAARHQLDIGLLYGGQSELEYQAAEKIVDMVPCAERVRFTGSGTEAVQLALRLARAVTGRSVVIKFEGHYHGWMDSTLWSTSTPHDQLGPEDAPVKQPASAGQDLPAGQNLEVMSWNRAEPLVARLAKGDVAAVIMEATMCNSGGMFAKPGYLEAVREACTRHGTILIFDEVITGFRTAPGGAQQRLGVTPDLATFAKAIANGFSVAAVAGRADIMDRLADGSILHGGTYNAQPAAMAAAIATMERLSKPGAHDGMERQGRRLMQGIEAAFTAAGIPVNIGGYPQIFTVNLGLTEKPVNYRGLAKVDKAGYRKFTTALLKHGVRALERGAWFLSTEHDEAVIDKTLSSVREALAEVAPELKHLRN